MTVGSSSSIPDYLVASSPQGLRRLCLLNNYKHGKQFVYTNIQFVNGKWYAWYIKDIGMKDANKELLSKDPK